MIRGSVGPAGSLLGMSTLDDWLAEASAGLALPDGPPPVETRTELLDLTRDVAHGVARVAGPLTCYLVGIAVGRGADPDEAAAAVRALAQRHAAETSGEAAP